MSLRLVPEAQQSAREYIQVAQPVFAQSLPDQDFFSIAWDVKPLRARRTGRAEIRFTRYGSSVDALPSGEPGLYTDVIKAFLIVERNGLSNLVMRFDAARFLWESLALRIDDPRDFRWAGVDGEDFCRAETLMADRLAPMTVYRTALQLQVLANTLASRGIIPEPRYRAMQKPTCRGGRADIDPATGDDAGMERLLSPAAIEAIQTVYQDPRTAEDELLISLIALMIAGSGFRANEVVTLPNACEVTDGVIDKDGKDYRWGLRFFKEKSPGGKRMLAVRGCIPAQQEPERDAWLNDHVQAVHETGIGYCTHDFSVEPCPFALNCLKQCPDYAVDLTNSQQKVQLVQLTYRTKQALESAHQAAANGILNAESWVRTHEETLAGAETVLRAFDAADPERLQIVRPFANQPSRYEPDLD